MLIFLPLLGMLQLVHWFFFGVDELFFRGYRDIRIKSPLFVTGLPRSGTTFLHRVLAKDSRYTTLSTWECLLAPAISERKIWILLGQIDSLLGNPLKTSINWITRQISSSFNDIHEVRLDAPEEDYLALLPILSSFILVVPFPENQKFWNLGNLDHAIDQKDKNIILNFYKSCLQKHLYVHGVDKTFLSKNAAFLSWAPELKKTFSEAHFIICERPPEETLPSQLSAIEGGVNLFHSDPNHVLFPKKIAQLFSGYYQQLRLLKKTEDNKHVFITMQDIKHKLEVIIPSAYQQFDIPLTDTYLKTLLELSAKSHQHQSSHNYSLEKYGLDESTMTHYFSETPERTTESLS